MNVRAEARLEAGGLDVFFHPRSIAVIGASRDPRKWGRRILDFTARRGFDGPLYGVNPAASPSGRGSPVRFVRDVGEIEDAVDLAVVAVPAPRVPDAVAECAEVGVRGIVIAGSGFAERNAAGKSLEGQVRRLAKQAGIRVLGPNGFGLYVAAAGINLTPKDDIPLGPVALATQSGNVAIALFQQAARAGIGFSSCFGLGNQADVTFGEVLQCLAENKECRSVACYVEGLAPNGGKEFAIGLAACAAAGKPVVVLKTGNSALGAVAVSTHTGSLAADDRVWDSVLAGAGAHRAHSTEHMVDILLAMTCVPETRGRLMVLTNGGGDSVMAADAIGRSRLKMARLSHQTREALETLTPRDAPRVPASNPVTLDTAGGVEEDPELIARCVRAVASDQDLDIVLVCGVFGGYRAKRAEELACVDQLLAARGAGIPIVMQSAYADGGEEPLEKLKQGGIPVYPTVQRAVSALSYTVAAETLVARRWDHSRLPVAEKGDGLAPVETASLLARYGVSLPPLSLVEDERDLKAVLRNADYPICVKLGDGAVSHKSDIGGVRLGLTGRAEAMRAANELWEAFPHAHLLVMPMLEQGLELLVGTSRDPVFGAVIAVGRGGIWTELEADVAIELAPVTPGKAKAMVKRLRCAPMLWGARGQPALDVGALGGLIAAVSRLGADHPELSVELNPVILHVRGYGVADVRGRRLEVDGVGATGEGNARVAEMPCRIEDQVAGGRNAQRPQRRQLGDGAYRKGG